MTPNLKTLATAVTCALVIPAAAAQAQTTTTEPTTTQAQPSTPAATTTTEPAATAPAPTATPTGTQAPATTSAPGTAAQAAATQTVAVAKATAADLKAGESVYDEAGHLVGKVVSATADSAIVNTGEVRAEIPLSGFGKNDKGLVISVTKADLNAQAKKGTTKPTKPTKPKS